MATKFQSVMSDGLAAPRPRIIPLALLMAVWIAAAWTDSASGQSVVNGLMTTTVDEPLKYEATGTVNTSNAWSDTSPPAVSGPWYTIPAKVPAPKDGLGAYWEFSVRHTATQFNKDQASNARLWVKGKHIRVPEPGHGEGLNNLPEIGTVALDVPTTKAANVSTWGGLQHLGATPPHSDFYGVVGKGLAYSKLGATATLGGTVDVIARHSESIPKEFKSWRIGSSLVSSGMRGVPDGSTVSFDATSRTLSFAPGRIDVLDLQGGLSGNIDPRYAQDPILGAQLHVSDLVLQGQQHDGRFQFSGGNVSVIDQFGQLGLHASFDEYIVGDTSQHEALDSFGVLSRGDSFEQLNTEMPTFLGDFVDDHLLGRMPTSKGFSDRVLDLAFITGPGMDLATLTNGFTTSAWFIPADIYVGGNGYDGGDASDHTPGDYNGDGLVDNQDYVVWHSDFGMTNSSADGNGNGIADAADYTVWRDHAGASFGLSNAGLSFGTSIAIPEPSMAALAMIALCLAVPASRIRSASKRSAEV